MGGELELRIAFPRGTRGKCAVHGHTVQIAIEIEPEPDPDFDFDFFN